MPLGQVKIGSKVLIKNKPYEIVEFKHTQMGRGGAKLTTKLRNLIDGSLEEQTFQGNEQLEEANIDYKNAQFLYAQGPTAHFMLSDSFEQVSHRLPERRLKLMSEDMPVTLMFWQNNIIDIQLPKKIRVAIQYTEPATKGNTVTAASKPAQLESGLTIQVPLFINTGDKVWVNTETGSYDSRV